jgi:hypothetical protein
LHLERLEDRLALSTFLVNTTLDTVAANLGTGKDAAGQNPTNRSVPGSTIEDDIGRIINPGFSVPGKPAPCCFAAWTPVLGPHGPRPISTLRPGDWVLGYWPTVGCFARTRVVTLDVHPGEFDLLSLHVPGPERLSVTPGHWFYTGADWVLSENLDRHGSVLSISGKTVPVTVTGPVRSEPLLVYNVQTECGTYLVGGYGLVVSGVVLSHLHGESMIEAHQPG